MKESIEYLTQFLQKVRLNKLKLQSQFLHTEVRMLFKCLMFTLDLCHTSCIRENTNTQLSQESNLWHLRIRVIPNSTWGILQVLSAKLFWLCDRRNESLQQKWTLPHWWKLKRNNTCLRLTSSCTVANLHLIMVKTCCEASLNIWQNQISKKTVNNRKSCL